mmetsp:Transcript_2120/g.5861  ORF Transcript_2120/g.5861 Transcript_2120/m.5861 type:complete len:205 (-) Transcript_2120:70-684(-)
MAAGDVSRPSAAGDSAAAATVALPTASFCGALPFASLADSRGLLFPPAWGEAAWETGFPLPAGFPSTGLSWGGDESAGAGAGAAPPPRDEDTTALYATGRGRPFTTVVSTLGMGCITRSESLASSETSSHSSGMLSGLAGGSSPSAFTAVTRSALAILRKSGGRGLACPAFSCAERGGKCCRPRLMDPPPLRPVPLFTRLRPWP